MGEEVFYLLRPGVWAGILIRMVWAWVNCHCSYVVVSQGIRWMIPMRGRVI